MTATVLLEYTQQRELGRHSYQAGEMMSRKKQRVSKGGRSSAFVPDNRLAVETVAESEGLGSLCREDTEMTASEDSCTRKRKCISLNDGCDRFGVPIQVVSVSKMSGSDKKKAQIKLRGELDQIRDLQKRIDDAWMIHGVAGNIQRTHGLSNGPGKRRPATGRGAVAPPKRGATGRFESANQQPRPPLQTAGATGCSNAVLFKQCRELLKKLMSHQYSWVFNTAVDVDKLNIPDYYTIIKQPMDLGTVKRNIEKGSYSSPLEFAADVRLTFSNAKTYNPSGNDVHIMADSLDQYFEVRWKAIEKKIASVGQPRVELGSSQNLDMSDQAMERNNSASAVNKTVTDNSLKRIMTASDKQKLIKDVEGFGADIPDHIIKFLQFHCHDPNAMDEDEIELDFEALSDDILFKLKKLIDDHNKASRAKAETSEVEVLNESGVSNSSMRPCKDNDPADEDVDICGNEPLIFPRFPPVEIEKDKAEPTRKCSSSSSSSSDSESSSSDSDTASSSDSDSDHVKVSSPGHAVKENAGVSDAAFDQEQSALLDPLHGNHSLSVVDQDKSNNIPVDGDRRQDGENALSERQVSPEKLYRAALLRNRFADTIRKAREKTHNQGADPEKLRLEREELERQQREDKARLDAEEKAALDARQRAELEAAAEARRQRELDRVASRLALQQMHKTVDLSDTSQFLKDLAMMGSVPGEDISCSLEENSPEHVFDGMGSFKLGKSNPLEQLGLFMKDDEEEEDEDEGNLVASAPNDVEEGEID